MFGLTKDEQKLILDVLNSYSIIEKIMIFGSRAQGNYRSNSDIDLVVWGQIEPMLLAKIISQLDEIPLPFLFDLKVYDDISHQALKDHIDNYAIDFNCIS